MSRSIAFLHGLFQNPLSWAHWKEYFEKLGYTCYTPAYPFHDGYPETLRKHPDPQLAHLTFGQVVDHLAAFIDTLPSQPILVGHSMGGLAVQKLIGMQKGSMGVCIDSAPPQGIISFEWSFLKANLATVNPLKGNSICLPSVEWFHYAFCNTMSLEQTRVEYDKYMVPESRNIPRSTTMKDGRIDFKRPHAPLLFIAGEKDNIIPPSLNRKNFNAYTNKNSLREFRQFEGRTHYICGQENWEEVADFIALWIKKVDAVGC